MQGEEAFQESVRSMRNQTLRADRAGDYWTDDEKNRLRILFDSGVGITEIALELGRTEPAVYQQIEKLDLYPACRSSSSSASKLSGFCANASSMAAQIRSRWEGFFLSPSHLL